MTTTVGASASPLTPLQCARCGAQSVGKYCSSCGHALVGRRDLSIKHFLREAALAVTDFDSALLGSFRTLLLRPGGLTATYLRGDRHRYLPPFRVFLLCNLLYFAAVSQFHTTVLTAPLDVQMDEMTYRNATRAIMVKRYPALMQSATERQRARRDAMRKTITTRYDDATEGIGKLIVVVLIPFYAIVLQLLFVGTKRYFAEHLVFATHLVSLLLLLIPASGLAVYGWTSAVYRIAHIRGEDSELPYVVAMTLWFGVYTFVAQRVAYDSGRVAALVRTTLLAGLILPIIVAFKFVLFLVTLYWIG